MNSMISTDHEPLPIAVLISGGGTTLKNLLDCYDHQHLPVNFVTIISSNPRAKGLEFARERQLDTCVIRKKQFTSAEAHRDAIFAHCRQRGAKLVVMAGYLEHLLIPADYDNCVINIHPSLIPAFCGQGFYGTRVHQAVLDYGAKISGCTVHFVDNDFDHGPIIAQRTCAVEDDDTPASLAGRVFQLECQLLPACIRAIAAGRVAMTGRRVSVSMMD